MLKDVLYVWNSIPLNDEMASATKRLELNSLSLEDAVTLAYPELSFCGIYQLTHKLSKSTSVNLQSLYLNYGYALDSKLSHLLTALPTLPESFLSWCIHHQLSPRDLFPLLSLPSPQTLQNQLETFSALSLSRNLGAQILELLVECFLISESSLNALPATTSGDAWLSQLKTLRFPQTQQNDLEKQKKMMSLPWPKDFQLRWQRQGDRSGLEVKFFVSHEKELQKMTQLLQQTSQQAEIKQ